jgi:hypothetical protein
MKTLKEWFCLKEGRDNFKLRVREDANLIFCHDDEIHNEIIGSIERRFAANEPIKMLIYGDWGVGKTHAAHHINWWLGQHKDTYPAKTIMVEVGDLERRSRFDSLVRPLLDAMGMEFLVELAGDYQAKKGNTVRALKDASVPEYVATTIAKFNLAVKGSTPPPVVSDALQILQGRKPGAGFASNGLGFQISESRDLFYVLYAIGEMYRAVHGHRILFVADEAARLDEVSNDEATLAHWIAVNRDIFDDKNNSFGFIYTLTGKADRLPEAIWHPQIQNRLGQNSFELRTLAKPDVEQFLERLVNELVDRSKVQALVADGSIDSSKFDMNSYPFERQAHTDFVEFFQRTQENAKPRDICDRLDLVGFVAIKSNSRLIDSACLQRANM